MIEDELLRRPPLADRLRITAVDLAVTGAPRALVEAVWLAVDGFKSTLGATQEAPFDRSFPAT